MRRIPQTREPFCCEQTAHFFFMYSTISFISENNIRIISIAILIKFKVLIYITSFGKIFPARRVYTDLFPHSRDDRQPSFYRTPSTKLAKLNYGRWVSTYIIRKKMRMSRKQIKCRFYERGDQNVVYRLLHL